MRPFSPDYVVTLATGEEIKVMLYHGAAYTEQEWNRCLPADYERQEDGSWTFQGKPFAGTVEKSGNDHA